MEKGSERGGVVVVLRESSREGTEDTPMIEEEQAITVCGVVAERDNGGGRIAEEEGIRV